MKETGALCTPHSIDRQTDSRRGRQINTKAGQRREREERRESLLQFNYCDGERERERIVAELGREGGTFGAILSEGEREGAR